MKPAIDFYFDFSSPYSYIASEWVGAVAARHGRLVNWRAILLGASFQVTGLRPPAEFPLKRDYLMRDVARSAAFAGVPLRMPEAFPIATQNAARVFWWLHAQEPQRAVDWARAALRAYFTRGVNLSEPQALKALCAEQGLDAQAAEAAWNDPQWKAALKAANEAAIAVGVFGAPYFVIDGEPFWGNDRQAQIEAWLNSGPPRGLE
ncbi:2-hydroxychromene-2-carboxylate isomerase [Inhella inkyongensis]|uniref:2-hydroxychromene-2-carboxylate isomerase n=1 Tax=Inhella inkyongensis TaxID=392593 RepID=A0A840S5D6_9BURK|nr:2-hydroxychromene-2-carboxylate isomerase [Inhella inkyongensis]MBB5204688.1 2-hydroxychromene-2-carboxylate isomerase [Inhella inkyongensis]